MLSTIFVHSNVTTRHLLIILWIKTLTWTLFTQWWVVLTIPLWERLTREFYSDLIRQCLCWNYYDWVFSLFIVSVLSCADIDSIFKSFIFFLAPPAFIKKPPTFVEVLLGDSLSLSCGAHGNPRPTVVWHKDDSQIEKHEKIKVSCISRCHGLHFNQLDYPLKPTSLLSSLWWLQDRDRFLCLSTLYPILSCTPF